jgi:hypothetical protein
MDQMNAWKMERIKISHEVQHVTVLPLHSVATQLWTVCCPVIHYAAVVPNFVLVIVLLVQGCLMVTDIHVVG